MRTLIISILVVMTILMLSGCSPDMIQAAGQLTSEERQVQGFKNVVLSGSGELILTRGEAESLTVAAPENLLPYIESEVRGSTLYLGLRPDASWMVFTSAPVRFYLTASEITGLTVAGSGDIYADQVETSSLDLKIQGSGSIWIDKLDTVSLENEIDGSGDIDIELLQADEIDTRIIGSGSCSLDGLTAAQNLYIGGSGDYQASGVKSETVTVNVGGSGSVEIWVTESLDVIIAGSGDVYYSGSPEVSYSVMGAGEIERIGDG
ncbi:MAG: DUF2807 domain-containing protein [Anaerolineales bacterium]|nr:DUF2807 domain-containing protein [Anaerolineales bacterium]